MGLPESAAAREGKELLTSLLKRIDSGLTAVICAVFQDCIDQKSAKRLEKNK